MAIIMTYSQANYCKTDYCSVNYCAPRGIGNLRSQITQSVFGSSVLNSQFSMATYNESNLHCQVNMVLYNTTQFRVLWEIASDGIVSNNFTASTSASTDKSIANIKTDIVEQYWQSTGTDEHFTFDVGTGRTSFIDTIGFINHNLTTSAVVNIYGYGTSEDPAPGSWAGVPLYATIPLPEDRPNEENLLWIAEDFPLEGFRHWRVTISDPTNPDGFIRVGRFVAGQALIFAGFENFIDRLNYGRKNFKDELSLNGYTTISNNRALKKFLRLTFTNLAQVNANNYKNLETMLEYTRDTLKMLVIPDPQNPYNYSVYAKIAELPEEEHRYVDADTRYADLTISWNEAQ
jgi:hypothetical protein